MSERRLFGLFSGAQVTLMVCAAIITPGAVYAVANTPVVITDPVTGHTSQIDASRRLTTYDPIAGYANDPANLIVIAGNAVANATKNIFTVPPGKALIVKAIHLAYFDGTTNFDNRIRFIDNNTGLYLTQIDDPNFIATFQADLGSGFYIHSGDGFSVQSTVDGSFTVFGYYVPANAVPVN